MSNVTGPLRILCTLPSRQFTFRDVVDIFCWRGCLTVATAGRGELSGSGLPTHGRGNETGAVILAGQSRRIAITGSLDDDFGMPQ